MPVFKIFAYKHFFVKTLVQISTSTKVNYLISKELYQAKWIQVYFRNCGWISENWPSLWRCHSFFPYELVLISELSKRSKLYHFNVLKCIFCFIINIWQKFKSYSRQFQSSNLHSVAEGPFQGSQCPGKPWNFF